ncbi:tetratricopeptide repeat protein (plasmid) [Sphingomonas sp. CJ20]
MEWLCRTGLAALALLSGYACVTHAFAYATRNTNAERAHALAPDDARIAGVLAQRLIGAGATKTDIARARQIATDALLQDPTAVAAVSTLGIVTGLEGRPARARRLFDYADRLSRRDLRTQLWAIEDAVGHDDVAGALRHYDIALRTSPQASAILFPILASAIDDPVIRTAVTQTFVGKPGWAPLFVEYISAKGPAPQSTSLLFQQLRRAGIPISDLPQALLIDTLASRGFFEDAWNYYTSVRPSADRRRSRDANFTAALGNPTLFDWQIPGTQGLNVSIERLDTGAVLDFSAPASVGGDIAQQVQLLPPGTYRIAGNSEGIDQTEGAQPYWVLRCREGRELGRVGVPNSALTNGEFFGNFTVPVDCPVQTLAFVALPSDAIGGSSGRIHRVQLAPLQ